MLSLLWNSFINSKFFSFISYKMFMNILSADFKCLHIFICLIFNCKRKSYNNIIAVEYAITLQFDSKFSNEKWKKSLIGIDERLLKKLLMEPSYRDRRFKSKGILWIWFSLRFTPLCNFIRFPLSFFFLLAQFSTRWSIYAPHLFDNVRMSLELFINS